MYKLTAAQAFKDNYIWVLSNDSNHALIVDPGDANVALDHIKRHKYIPSAILLTHHHFDHIGGVCTFSRLYPHIAIYGPAEVARSLPTIPIIDVDKTSEIKALGMTFEVIKTPGHTAGHVSYYSKPYLFCGDVLFSGGCGRIFEGDAADLFHSLSRLSELDNKTLICSAHEYTLDNLKFAHHILPEDFDISQRLREVQILRKKGEMTLPTTLALEKKINLFMRCHNAVLQKKLECYQPDLLFAQLRSRKDKF